MTGPTALGHSFSDQAFPYFAFTGYATLGYARSNQDYPYLRYIDNNGTLKADSLFGMQLEARFNAQWGATLQGVVSAPRTRDAGTEASVRWAFVSFRPTNDWLIRAGRFRPPVFINTQNEEVGVTYDQARLPVEVYSLSPVYDADGAAFTRTWPIGDAQVDIDAYWGTTKIKYRIPYQSVGEQVYFPENMTIAGVVVSYISDSLLLRAGYHRALAKPGSPGLFFETFAPVSIDIPPPNGGALYVPVNPLDSIGINVLTLGADWRSGDWRITGEYGQRVIRDTTFGPDSRSGYVTAARSVGKWTPYLTYARLQSGAEPRNLYATISDAPVPLAVQGPPQNVPPDYHHLLAEKIVVFDQYSTMLGTSYSFSATSKLKFEWMRTHIGVRSALVDANVRDQGINVFTVAYSVTF